MAEKVFVSPKFSKRRFSWSAVAIFVGVLVLGVIVGGGVRYLQTHHSAKTPTQPKTPMAVARDQGNTGDIAGSQSTIQQALTKPGLSKEDYYNLYYQQGANYQSSNDQQKALDSYKKAATYLETDGLYVSMADAAQALGDKALAITYYKKAIQLVPASNPTGDQIKQGYQQVIIGLGGTP